MTEIVDPALIGIWLLPGEPQTYEIAEDGSYFIAEPDEPLRFENNGMRMVWGERHYSRIIGEGDTPVGTWHEESTGDGWDFTSDNGYSILNGQSAASVETFTGIWALRNEGTRLWTCERQALIEADGANLTFLTPAGDRLSYGYTVDDGVLTLHDSENWQELIHYISAERMVRSAAG